jgi:hypothetical protein
MPRRVSDHALRLRAEDGERVGAGQQRVALALEGEHADLRAVAVADDQLVPPGQRGEGLRGRPDVLQLDSSVGFVAVLEQRVAAEGDDNAHVSRPARRRGPPRWCTAGSRPGQRRWSAAIGRRRRRPRRRAGPYLSSSRWPRTVLRSCTVGRQTDEKNPAGKRRENQRAASAREAEPVSCLRKLEKPSCWLWNALCARIRDTINVLLRTLAAALAQYLRMQRQDRSLFLLIYRTVPARRHARRMARTRENPPLPTAIYPA